MRTETETQPLKINDYLIEHFGHRSTYRTHTCPTCEFEWLCLTPVCRLESTVECLPCANRQLLEDTERFSKEARRFLATALPTDDQTLMWWRALRSEIDGKLKGLGERVGEVLKRSDSEIKP